MELRTDVADAPLHPIVPLPPVPFRPYYQDDLVTIYNANCRQVIPFLDRFDLLLTDPPYGVGAGKGGAGKGQRLMVEGGCEWDKQPVSELLLLLCIEAAKEACIWGGNYYALPPCRGMLIWDKKQPMEWYSTAHFEYAWTTRNANAKAYRMSQVEVHSKMDKVHPTQKPIGLMQWCLGIFPECKTILDPFAGSGTTGVACKLEGRKAVLIEMDERYCESAAKRLSQGTLF